MRRPPLAFDVAGSAVRSMLAALLALAVLGTAAGGGRAETRALLVGVSDYPDGIGIADLRGPGNDVSLIRTVLAARGVTDLTLLADGVENGRRPTLAAIRAAFSDLAARAEAGDLVVLHFSGHGTRQPDADGDEVDGYDEVFLPADVARPPRGQREIPNALVDDEIGRAVSALRSRGADVWLVVDSCNSGTAVRAAAGASRARYVDPAVFGFDGAPAVAPREEGMAGAPPELPAGAGGLIAFYAAQSHELAREVDYGAGGSEASSGPSGWYGLFTSKLAARLQTVGEVSYRQLFQAVLSDMNERGGVGGAVQTPYWEGTLAEAPVLGGTAAPAARQFPLSGRSLAAGLVHGIREGDVFAAVADAADPPEAALGRLRAVAVEPLRATLEPVRGACAAGDDDCAAAEDGRLAEARFARLVAPSLDLALTLAPPVPLGTPADPRQVDPELASALRAVLAMPAERLGGLVRLDAETPDLLVTTAGGRLWFGEEASVLGHPAGASWGPEEGRGALAALLQRILRAHRLLVLAEAVEDARLFPIAPPVSVAALLAPANPALLAPELDPREECGRVAAAGEYGPARPLAPGEFLKQCDRLAFTTSSTGGAYDVNMIYVDAAQSLGIRHARIEGAGQDRPFLTLTACSECPGGIRSAGPERALFLITRAAANADQLNLEPLAAGGATRAGAGAMVASPLARLMAETLAAGTATRGTFSLGAAEDVWVEAFRWRVLPRQALEAMVARNQAPDE